MTEKELHKLRRPELLEMLLEMRMELDQAREANATLQEKLEQATGQQTLLEAIWREVSHGAPLPEPPKETALEDSAAGSEQEAT